MTDEEIVKAAGEKVMGWTFQPCGGIWESDGKSVAWAIVDAGIQGEWNPLTSDADACAVLDALIARPHVIVNLLMSLNPRGWWVEVGHPDRHTRFWCADRRRAIVLAALKAVGVNA